MAERHSRPGVQEIKDAYDHLFNSSTALSKIKDAALGGRLFNLSSDPTAGGLAGRSLAWKLFLVETEPLRTAVPDAVVQCPIVSLRTSRDEYQRLLLDTMRAPDGSYADGVLVPGTTSLPLKSAQSGGNLDQNNPLSLHDENPWTAWFASMELRKTILQDVERTFPDIAYFRDQEVQNQLTNILFVYSVTHPDIGYRQGMHELLAPLYHAIDYDSVSEDDSDIGQDIQEFCSRAWVAADAWALFSLVMLSAGRWYEWQEIKVASVSKGQSPIPSHIHLSAIPDISLKPYVAPIIEACNRIQSVLLKSVDPQLWRSLQSSGIEPQIYGIRWLRLLFTREFGMDDAMMLWDGLFACDPSFELAPWVCVAMLIRIRNKLIPADYSTQLTFLLHYPSSPGSDDSPNITPTVNHASLLLRQALTLQMSPTAATGTSIISENHNLLNIPTEVPDPPPPPARRRARTAGRGELLLGSSDGGSSALLSGRPTHARMGSTPMGLPEMIARGLLERGESLGINKTVMNAVSELKRNLPDLATSLARLPTSPSASETSFASYPLVDERPTLERPPWEPKTRFEMEREASELRATQRRLGDSVAWIVDTLLLDEESGDEERIHERKREAVECLSYVRDILKGVVQPTNVEESRLWGEDELKRRKKVAEEQKQAEEKKATEAAERLARSSLPAARLASVPLPPQPTASVSSSPFHSHSSASMRRLPDNMPPGSTFPRSTLRTPLAAARASSPAPTISVLQPNANAVPLAPWTYTRSAFSSNESPIATLPRMPSKPSAASAVRHGGARTTGSPYASSQTPPEEASSRAQPPPQDPLGVLR